MKSLDDYEVISVIGSGSFGTCFKIQDKITNKIYAWKAINYDDDEFQENKKEILDTEIGFLQQLKHPNIVQYYDNICNIETKTIFIIMEYCDGGDLQNLIRKCIQENLKFDEKYIWKILYQISKALQLCHNKITEGCILHRDIKPANIFLDKCGNCKLGDFGLARIIKRTNRNQKHEENFANSIVGSPYYMSPEIVKGRKYDKKTDIWAVGCLIYEMCCLKPPFNGKRFEQLSKNISNGYFKSIPNYYTKDLQEIISFLLEVDSEQRPNVEILLRHPVFIRNLNDLKADFPKLLPRNTNEDDNLNETPNQIGVKKLIFSPTIKLSDVTNFTFSDLNNIDDFNNESNLRITGINTPELREELFGVARNNIPRISSFPDINLPINENERIYANSIMTTNFQYSIRERIRNDDPQLITRDVFEEDLKIRLDMIRSQEMLLKQREINLMEKEKELMDRERRLTLLEKDLEEKKHHVEGMLKRVAVEKRSTSSKQRYPKRRISKTLDDSYCTIEPNEYLICPTVAKLEIPLINHPLANLRNNPKKSVTFTSSPKKIFKVNNESVTQPQPTTIENLSDIKLLKNHKNDNEKKTLNNNFQSSLSSKTSTSTESENNNNNKTSGKRRSILSIFGININSQKHKGYTNNNNICKDSKESNNKQSILSTQYSEDKKLNNQTKNIEVIDKLNSDEISQIWTKENKKAAFEMLAAINAADKETNLRSSCINFVNSQRNSNIRRTTRERGTSLNRSSKLRRSAVYLSPNTSGNRIIL